MNWKRFAFWKARGSATTSVSSPGLSSQQGILLSPLESTQRGAYLPVGELGRRTKRSWWGWLTGRNRRRDGADRMVQGELLLRQVRPVRNDFRDDAVSLSDRRASKLLYETPPSMERRDDQDVAWNRLRNRETRSLVVHGE